MIQNKPPTVLVCPLDWGMGHATRCLPVIHSLLQNGCRVIVAADGKPFDFLYKELSERVEFVRFEGKPIQYPRGGLMLVKLAMQVPGFFLSILKENKKLEKLILETGASVVISDNRFGLWNRKVRTVFITHQLNVQIPFPLKFIQPLSRWVVRKFAESYDFCWVPDTPLAPGLSGELSHVKPPKNVRYVGILSRFGLLPESEFKNPLPKDFPDSFYFAILSGPEPQRGILETLLTKQFLDCDLPVVMALGSPGQEVYEREKNLLKISHLGSNQFGWLLKNARLIICRSGYSSLMDISVFGKKALLIPTPGQTEQEYLAQKLHSVGMALYVRQEELILDNQLHLAEKCTGIPSELNQQLLQRAIEELLTDH